MARPLGIVPRRFGRPRCRALVARLFSSAESSRGAVGVACRRQRPRRSASAQCRALLHSSSGASGELELLEGGRNQVDQLRGFVSEARNVVSVNDDRCFAVGVMRVLSDSMPTRSPPTWPDEIDVVGMQPDSLKQSPSARELGLTTNPHAPVPGGSQCRPRGRLGLVPDAWVGESNSPLVSAGHHRDVSRTPIVTLEVHEPSHRATADEPACRNQRPPATARARTFA